MKTKSPHILLLSTKNNAIRRHPAHRTVPGFTLIELMVTITIIGILIAVAVPVYNSSIQKSRRTDAKNALLDLATREEKYFSVSNTYSTDPTVLYSATSSAFPLTVQSSSTSYYVLTLPVITAASGSSAATFSISASATGTQATDSCGNFTLTNFGVTSVSTTASNWW